MLEDYQISKFDDIKDFVDALGFCKYCKNKFDKYVFK